MKPNLFLAAVFAAALAGAAVGRLAHQATTAAVRQRYYETPTVRVENVTPISFARSWKPPPPDPCPDPCTCEH